MISNIEQAINYLFNLRRFGVKYDILPVMSCLRILGNPQKSFPSIHVAGTNGKGSTCGIINTLFMAHGFKTGLFTSPHLTRFSERIQINGNEISDIEILEYLNQIISTDVELSFFETATVMAMLHFSKNRIDFAVIETGLGGRLDATRVCESDIQVITSIENDHPIALTTSLVKIAWEKAGIFSYNSTVVLPEFPSDIQSVISRRAHASGSHILQLNRDFHVSHQGEQLVKYFDDSGDFIFKAPLVGNFQYKNIALGITAFIKATGIQCTDISPSSFSHFNWPGRFERIENFILDGAHNPAAAKSLVDILESMKIDKINLIIGGMADKNLKDFIITLRDHIHGYYVTAINSDRAMPPDKLALSISEIGGEVLGVHSDIELLIDSLRGKETVLVSGSFYLVGKVRSILLGIRDDSLFLTDPST
ncbi:MAG: hypothetical protein JXR95_16305 [Deltaproteobacteria bacterium]|nr:hypothetical protein [Deltaproteobacteria bacterium]